jgi:PilZ domain
MGRERRTNFRVEWNSPGIICHGKVSRSCVLVNLSNGGARIAGVRANTLPDEFTLRLTRGQSGIRQCRVLWRSHDTVGVAFIDRITSTDEPTVASPVREPEPTR